MMLRTRNIILIKVKMEKSINIDTLSVEDIICRIQYNEEKLLEIIEGLAEAASSLCYYEEEFQSIKAVCDAQKILCELLHLRH